MKFLFPVAQTPAVPGKVKASKASGESVMVQWESADRAVSYDVIVTSMETSVPINYK